jgi:hypothetical protein
LIAVRTLAGTGITTYNCPVSVHRRQVADGHAIPALHRLTGIERLDFVQRVVPVLVVAVGELGGRRAADPWHRTQVDRMETTTLLRVHTGRQQPAEREDDSERSALFEITPRREAMMLRVAA